MTVSRRARAGAGSRPRERRASPTERRASPSTGTRRQLPSSQSGAAVAGTMAAPNPWNASVAMRRRPSTSALARSSMPAAAASRSSSSRNAVPLGSSSSAWSAEVGEGRHARARASGWSSGAIRMPVLVEERLGGHLRVGHREVHHRQVELVGEEAGDERGGGGVDDDHVHLRVRGGDGLEHERHQPARGGADAAEPHRAGDLVAQRRHVGVERVELRLHPPGPAHDGLALLGEEPAGAVEEGHAELPLEPRQVRRDVRLHRVQGPGGGGDAAAFGDGDQGGELAEIHRWSRCYPSETTV